VIRLGALGDVARTLPAFAALRGLYPEARISWLVEPAAAGVLRLLPGLDDVIVLPRNRLEADLRELRPFRLLRRIGAVVRELRGRDFDLVLDFHSILKSGLLALASGAAIRVAYARPLAREGAWLFANRRVDPGVAPISRFARNAALVESLGARLAPDSTGRLPVSDRALEAMGAVLGDRARSVVIHPGSSAGTAYKRYEARDYGGVARGLAREAGLHCIVARGPGEAEAALAQQVVECAGGAASLAPVTEDVESLAALLAGSRLFIGSDSGPLHLASLVGTPVVQILGPTHPVENEPWAGTPWRRVCLDLPCSPCRTGCGPAGCLRELPASAVVAAALELLPERRQPTRTAGQFVMAQTGANS